MLSSREFQNELKKISLVNKVIAYTVGNAVGDKEVVEKKSVLYNIMLTNDTELKNLHDVIDITTIWLFLQSVINVLF